uniref:cell wall hydrolase n=1 Tax=Sporofaciens musculi TaxID=2681861 RepID=UPI002589CA74
GTSTSPPVEANVSDVALFAALLECEASGYDPMLAVATVVMNRVASSSYPNTLRGVIYQSGQFAPTWNGSLEKALARGPSSTSYSVAQAALGGSRHASVINCYQFRSAWTGVSGINIGGNIFF